MQNKHPKEIHLKVPDALGDTVISTAVMRALGKAYFPDTTLIVYAKNPSLLESCGDIDELHPISELPRSGYISLDGYLNQMPHTAQPHTHISHCMINEAESELKKQSFGQLMILPITLIGQRLRKQFFPTSSQPQNLSL